MQTVATFAIDPKPEASGETGSRLLRNGQDTGTIVPGIVLEAQLAHHGEHLLFLTHDIPFEEQLEICLLDKSDKLVDRVWLTGANTTGNFRNLEMGPGGSATFDFFGTRKWRVTVLDRPKLFLPIIDRHLGVHRKLGFASRLLVQPI